MFWGSKCKRQSVRPRSVHNVGTLAIEKIGDWEKLEILVQNQLFWNIVGALARPTAAPCNSGRYNATGIIIVWRISPPLMLHIHSLHHFATVTPSFVPLRRREICSTIFHGFETNCMVPSDWDSAPRCICGSNFISDLIGESPNLSAARTCQNNAAAKG